jgi:hypothetical protein
MIEKSKTSYIFNDESGKWTSEHNRNSIEGPLALSYKNDLLISECSGYVGSANKQTPLATKTNEYHKSGESIIETEGYIANGDGRAQYKHIYKYANRRLKVTTDVQFSYDFKVDRHFSLGSLFLPGAWQTFTVIPPAFHQCHSAQTLTREIPKATETPLMLGHWHRAPLAMTFVRPNGTAIEIGTGSDVWRWEENLGYAPESGSYKIILEKDGLRIIREPLACCEGHIPESRSFRFSWYLAWRENGAKKKLDHHHAVDINFQENGEFDNSPLLKQIKEKKLFVYAILDRHKLTASSSQKQRYVKSPYDYIRGVAVNTKQGSVKNAPEAVCWANKSIVTAAKKVVRKLANIDGLDGIIFKNFTPDYCYHPSHVNKKHANGTVHWDINGLFDFSSWAKNFCSEKLSLFVEADKDCRPSITGLFE